ncbi:hypothetical protein KIH41_07985 [Litoribacter ruber]|uniref:hypothetical protein n=1 Tax=Litoribacter ruber TaxID=702568 RepID=UPI001BDB6028|nr:hypothetical protein [Litoribacter ruber]MBT0811217.1 hypothetical protein [Litoribacter ruber]
MKKLFSMICLALCACLTLACGSAEKSTLHYEPELIVTDSLIIDYLGNLQLLDFKPDRSEYLLYDFQRSELVRVDQKGTIRQKANRSMDGKDSYQSRFFITANYRDNGDLLIETFGGLFVYDSALTLKEKRKLPYELATGIIGGSRVTLPIADYLYAFSVGTDDRDRLQDASSLHTYPFLTAYDLASDQVTAREPMPEKSQMVQNPGVYRSMDPIPLYRDGLLHLMFMYSPEIYVYDFPSLKLKEVLNLNPEPTYRQLAPVKNNESFDRFFSELASSHYTGFAHSNGYLLTSYMAAAPQEEVDALPKDVVGGPDYLVVRDKYKNPYYQVFSEKEKVWEGKWDVDLKMHKDVIYSTHQPGVDPQVQERDEVVFYFYELK